MVRFLLGSREKNVREDQIQQPVASWLKSLPLQIVVEYLGNPTDHPPINVFMFIMNICEYCSMAD